MLFFQFVGHLASGTRCITITVTVNGEAMTRAVEPRLNLADFLRAEGLTGTQMRERFPSFADLWTADSGTAQMPSGESLTQVQERAWRSVALMQERHQDQVVVAVTHNFVVQTIICKVLQVPIHTSRRFRQDLGSITRLELAEERSVLVSLNETLHLQGIDA